MSLRTVQRPGGDEVEGHIIPESTRKRQGGEVEDIDIEAHSRHAANWTAHQGEQRLDGHKIDPATPGPAPVLPFRGLDAPQRHPTVTHRTSRDGYLSPRYSAYIPMLFPTVRKVCDIAEYRDWHWHAIASKYANERDK